jgi:hypothetical protein
MVGSTRDDVVDIGAKHECLCTSRARHFHLDREKWRVLDRDIDLLDGCHKVEAAVGIAPQNAGEQADQRFPADGAVLVEPRAVATNGHADVAAVGRIPAFDRRQTVARLLLQKGFEAAQSGCRRPFAPRFAHACPSPVVGLAGASLRMINIPAPRDPAILPTCSHSEHFRAFPVSG